MKHALAAIGIVLLVGCAFGDGEGHPRNGFLDAQLGRDLGGAAQRAIQGEYIAGGIAAVSATLAATARYFFRRGETSEQKKTAEVETRVKKVLNGSAGTSADPSA